MRILFTADLHLNIATRNPRTRLNARESLSDIIAREDPCCVVVAGDIGACKQAHVHLATIRKAVGERLLAITLGNHDFWMDSRGHSQFSCLDQMVTRYWREPARDVGAVLLDRENADLGDFSLVGGYGHFDLGLAEPNLQMRGRRITEDIYLSGGMNGLFWNDFRSIPNCATRVRAEAEEQAEGFTARMDEGIATGKRILVATHTCPWRELNGHPLSGTETDILSAYSGNSMIGREIEKRAASVDFLMCGHTHMPVRERTLHGIPCLNVGADYGLLRGVIYETDSKKITWVGEPLASCDGDTGDSAIPLPHWWERLEIIQEPYPHIPEKEILAAMPADLHRQWEQFIRGQGVLALDDGAAGINPCDFSRFKEWLQSSARNGS